MSAVYRLCAFLGWLELYRQDVTFLNHTQFALTDTALWSTPLLQGLAGLLLSPGRGLLVYSPIFVLSIVGAAIAWRRGGDPLLRALSVGIALTVVVYARWVSWSCTTFRSTRACSGCCAAAGLPDEPSPTDPIADQLPPLAGYAAASIQGRVASSPAPSSRSVASAPPPQWRTPRSRAGPVGRAFPCTPASPCPPTPAPTASISVAIACARRWPFERLAESSRGQKRGDANGHERSWLQRSSAVSAYRRVPVTRAEIGMTNCPPPTLTPGP